MRRRETLRKSEARAKKAVKFCRALKGERIEEMR